MFISEILGLGRKEIWPVYRELAWIRRNYIMNKQHPCVFMPSDRPQNLRVVAMALDAIEPGPGGVVLFEAMSNLFRDLADCDEKAERMFRGLASRTPVTPKGGRPKDMDLIELVVRLRGIYTVRTKRKPKCYASEAKGRYQGDFFFLCELVAKEDLKEKGRSISRILNSIPGAQ